LEIDSSIVEEATQVDASIASQAEAMVVGLVTNKETGASKENATTVERLGIWLQTADPNQEIEANKRTKEKLL
jgi:hypothetical protein